METNQIQEESQKIIKEEESLDFTLTDNTIITDFESKIQNTNLDVCNPQTNNTEEASIIDIKISGTSLASIDLSKNESIENKNIKYTNAPQPEEKKSDNNNGSEPKLRLEKGLEMTFVSSFTTTAQITSAEEFQMSHWVELQAVLKNNNFVILNETQSKKKIVEEIDQLIIEYNDVFLKIRENNERIRKTLEKEMIIEEEMVKVIIDKDDVFGDAALFVRKLLYLVYERPKVLATLVKSSPELSSLKAFEETLCTTFYEDIIADEVYDDDLIRLLAELLELDFNKANKFADLLYTDQFTNKMLASYLKRNECRRYMKSLLKNPLLSIMKETTKIRLDPIDIMRHLVRRPKAQKSTMIDSSNSRNRQTTGSTIDQMVNSKKNIHLVVGIPQSEEQEEIVIPRFKGKKHRNDNDHIKTEQKEESKSAEFGMIIKSDHSPLERIEDREVVHVLERNFFLIKKHLSVLIQSIFDNLHSMPIGIRILCKIIYMLARKKFPSARDKDYNEVLSNFIFRKWISPNFLSPEHNGIINDFQTNEETIFNLTEIAKILNSIFNQNFFDPQDIKSELNDFMREIQPSVQEYYKELIAVNEDLVTQIRQTNRIASENIKSLSICISLQEIKLLCESVSKQKEKLKTICPEIVNLSEKVLFFSKESEGALFGDKIDPNTKLKIKPNQCYILFQELIFPPRLITNYVEEFNKIQGFSKDLHEEQKLLCRTKHLIKNFLIQIEDIKNMIRSSKDGKITLDDVLDKYEDKIYSYESRLTAGKEKAPTHISARFIKSVLEELDPSFRENNYYKIYQGVSEDFKKISGELDFSISTTKLQLLRALDALKRNYSSLYEVNEKKKKAIKKALVRDFIKSTKIPLCITSPSTARTLGAGLSKMPSRKSSTTTNTDKAIPDKIVINTRDEKGCIHERFAIIRELAASGGMLGSMGGGGGGRSYSHSISYDRKSSMLGDGSEDVFNENNYHCNTIDEFINLFGNIKEVKEVMETGVDDYGVSDAIVLYYQYINREARNLFKTATEEEYSMVFDEIEEYICKRLYNKIYPSSETATDRAFSERCKRFEWVTFTHLEIIPRNRCVAMWQYAAKVLNEMDNRITPLEKLECMVECFKTITQVLELASAKEGGGGADETLPIMIYILLKASPKRLHSNLNFITLLRDNDKMLAGEGYCFTQVRSAVMTIEQCDHTFFKVSAEEFEKLKQEKEKEYNLIPEKVHQLN